MEYKIEDLAFYKMKKSIKFVSNAATQNGKFGIFEIENQLGIDDKIKLLDEVRDGIGTYMLDLLNKWEIDSQTLPKEQFWDTVKTVSKKAWLKRNDPRVFVNDNRKVGRYFLLGTSYGALSTICPTTEHGFNMAYTGENIVNQWFHDLCVYLYEAEARYFKEHDSYQIKIQGLRDLSSQYRTCFDSKELNDFVWNSGVISSEEKVDEYIIAYQKLGKAIDDISKGLK